MSRDSENFVVRSAKDYWLPAVIVLGILLLFGSYSWLRLEPPLKKQVAQKTPADRLQAALLVNPGNHQGHFNLGCLLQAEGRLDEAITHYRQAIAIFSDDAGYHNNLGAALAGQGKRDEAARHFQAAMECDPDNAETEFNFGNLLISMERYADAIGHYRRAIALKSDYAKAYNNLAVALKKTGHHQEAYQYRLEAMRLEREQ